MAQATEFADEDFSLRFSAALSRFSPYADVAGAGGASAASKWSSSINPASPAWRPTTSALGISLVPQYTQLCLSEGSKLHVISESPVWDGKEKGVFMPGFAQAHSNRSTIRQGLEFEYDMNYYQMQWSKRLDENLAVGAHFNFAESQTNFDLGMMRVSKTNAESYDFRLGGLFQPVEKWLVGLVFDYGFSPSRTTLYDWMGTGLGNVKIHDTMHQYLLRPGISYEYKEDSAVYFDYQMGYFYNEADRLEVHRFFLGVDHAIVKQLFLRGGVAQDVTADAAWTVGVGIYPNDWLSIDAAYQRNMFPELSPEFGNSSSVTLSLGITF